jgi:hypothetical protein
MPLSVSQSNTQLLTRRLMLKSSAGRCSQSWRENHCTARGRCQVAGAPPKMTVKDGLNTGEASNPPAGRRLRAASDVPPSSEIRNFGRLVWSARFCRGVLRKAPACQSTFLELSQHIRVRTPRRPSLAEATAILRDAPYWIKFPLQLSRYATGANEHRRCWPDNHGRRNVGVSSARMRASSDSGFLPASAARTPKSFISDE